MTYKQIEASREIRLWIGQVLVPATALIVAISPDARKTIVDKAASVKESIKNRFNKNKRS